MADTPSTSIPTGSDLQSLISAVGLVTGTNTSGTSTNSGGKVLNDWYNSGATTKGDSNSTVNGSGITRNSGSVNTIVNSGSTNTQQLILSNADEDTLVNRTLGSTQGLAAVASNQHQSGGYNTTTEQMLGNDLVARTTSDVAALAAPTVTHIGGSTTTQNIGASTSSYNTSTNTFGVTDSTVGPSSGTSSTFTPVTSTVNTGAVAPKVGAKTA